MSLIKRIPIGSRTGDPDCCTCCGGCYCTCCPCTYSGGLCFDMIACSVTPPSGPTTTCMCNDMSFTMTQNAIDCYDVHSAAGGQCGKCPGEFQDVSDPNETGNYIETWGFSGIVCDDCTTSSSDLPDDYEVETSDCAGMGIQAGLCCCKTGFVPTKEEKFTNHPCAVDVPTACTSAHELTCDLECMWFHLVPINVYASVPGGPIDSPCSPCTNIVDDFGIVWNGEMDTIDHCPQIVSGQCGCPASVCETERKFMIKVTGSMNINCDCQTGVFDSAVPEVFPVLMTYSGLITEC